MRRQGTPAIRIKNPFGRDQRKQLIHGITGGREGIQVSRIQIDIGLNGNGLSRAPSTRV